MRLEDLKPNPGSRRGRKRVGRGIGSGHGKSAGRGTKGQKARNTVRRGFEGGQTPLHRRLPRFRGFKNRFAQEYEIVNLSQLAAFEAGSVVTPEAMCEKGLLRRVRTEKNEEGAVTVTGDVRVKVLGDGEVDRALTVRAHKFSKSAVEKLTAHGGTAEVIEG
jgi:large subunit ribosomal protein L15